MNQPIILPENTFEHHVFQIVLVSLAAIVFVCSVIALIRGKASRGEGLFWAFLSLTAGFAAAWPSATSQVAHFLGIGRGTDLILYCAVIVMMVGFWMTYMRLRRLRQELTKVVRHIALLEGEKKSDTDERVR